MISSLPPSSSHLRALSTYSGRESNIAKQKEQAQLEMLNYEWQHLATLLKYFKETPQFDVNSKLMIETAKEELRGTNRRILDTMDQLLFSKNEDTLS